MAESLLARIARMGGNRLVNHAVGRIESNVTPKKTTLAGKLAGVALMRIATRSVPGAIVVTGGLIAKNLHDRRKARKQAGNAPAAAKDAGQ